LGVITEIDKHLRGACVWTSRGKGDVAGAIALRYGIVLDGRGPPHFGDLRVGVQSKLHDEAGEHAEETRLVEELIPGEIVKAVRTQRRPGARHLYHKLSLGRRELHAIDIGRFQSKCRRIQQSGIRGHWKFPDYGFGFSPAAGAVLLAPGGVPFAPEALGAAAGEMIVAVLMLSSFGKFLSRYAFPSFVISP